MKNFTHGVSYYTRCKVTLLFPEDDICCIHCPLMGVELKTDRKYCRRTGEYLLCPNETLGFECPIEAEVTNDEQNV